MFSRTNRMDPHPEPWHPDAPILEKKSENALDAPLKFKSVAQTPPHTKSCTPSLRARFGCCSKSRRMSRRKKVGAWLSVSARKAKAGRAPLTEEAVVSAAARMRTC